MKALINFIGCRASLDFFTCKPTRAVKACGDPVKKSLSWCKKAMMNTAIYVNLLTKIAANENDN